MFSILQRRCQRKVSCTNNGSLLSRRLVRTVSSTLCSNIAAESDDNVVPVNQYKKHRILRKISRNSNVDEMVSEMFNFQKIRDKEQDQIMAILRRDGLIKGESAFIDAIHSCHREANYQTALRIFDEMKSIGIIQSVDSCNALLQCLCDCDRTELAYKYFKSFAINQINSNSIRILLSGCKQRTLCINIAENVWKRMIFECGIIPDIDICHHLLTVYIRNQDVFKVDLLWKHLQSIDMINSAICAEMMSMKGQNPSYLLSIKKVMKQYNLEMDTSHYIALLKCKESVLEICDEIKQRPELVDERLLYFMFSAFLQMKIPKTLLKRYLADLSTRFGPILGESDDHDLHGIWFEAQLRLRREQRTLDMRFSQMVADRKLPGYWTPHTMEDGRTAMWIDLHGIYARKNMAVFLLRHLFRNELRRIAEEFEKSGQIVILCGYGHHSSKGVTGRTIENVRKELMRWQPFIRSTVCGRNNDRVELNEIDLEKYLTSRRVDSEIKV